MLSKKLSFSAGEAAGHHLEGNRMNQFKLDSPSSSTASAQRKKRILTVFHEFLYSILVIGVEDESAGFSGMLRPLKFDLPALKSAGVWPLGDVNDLRSDVDSVIFSIQKLVQNPLPGRHTV